MKAMVRRCATRHHSHHYFGFAETQWKLFLKESLRRVKPLLYGYRVLLTGIRLMRIGAVEANLVALMGSCRVGGASLHLPPTHAPCGRLNQVSCPRECQGQSATVEI
jgi:hypothetical protein